MSSDLHQVFADVKARAESLTRYWNNFHEEIYQYLPEMYYPEIAELTHNLSQAFERLVEALQNPVLTLATTGTTSSGKSTVVNFLCGAEIVPVAVSEMSAGSVTIEYHRTPSLTIPHTSGAVWECGEWHGISDEKIYQRLNDAMLSYIDQREQNSNLACPQFFIQYPFRFWSDIGVDLPKGSQMRILDLPGLAYVGDEGNASVIRQCREALCIVTYNSAETDPHKVSNLLQEVVEQVKDLGGSPARMLFVLNRIDVFRADRNWPETENRFVDKTVKKIKAELTDRLQEYAQEIENLQIVKFCSWPALLSMQIKSVDDLYSVDACKKADNHFNSLIEDILEDLPRNTQKWSIHDRHRVSEALWEKSYAGVFQEYLAEHIRQHFPQLVIPQIIDRFNDEAGNAVSEWAVQTTSAMLNSSEETFTEEVERIEHIQYCIERFLEESNFNLRKPFEDINKLFKKAIENDTPGKNPIHDLQEGIYNISNKDPFRALGKNKLYPLYGWRRELKDGIEKALESIAASLDTGRIDLGTTQLKKADHIKISLLARNLRQLVDLGYTPSVAKYGATKEARQAHERNNLRQLNERLNDLALNLSLVMNDIVQNIVDQEINRVYQTVDELFKWQLAYLEKGTREIAPDIAIKFPESQLIKITRKLNFGVDFEAGFPVTHGTWEEKITEAVQKRVWWKLWLGKSTVYETRYETRSSDNATIPSTKTLIAGWLLQSQRAEAELAEEIIGWLLDQIDGLKKNVSQVQNDIISRYKVRLETAHQEVTLDYETQQRIWKPIQKEAQQLESEFNSMKSILSITEGQN